MPTNDNQLLRLLSIERVPHGEKRGVFYAQIQHEIFRFAKCLHRKTVVFNRMLSDWDRSVLEQAF